MELHWWSKAAKKNTETTNKMILGGCQSILGGICLTAGRQGSFSWKFGHQAN